MRWPLFATMMVLFTSMFLAAILIDDLEAPPRTTDFHLVTNNPAPPPAIARQ